jgi:hypothetical protein
MKKRPSFDDRGGLGGYGGGVRDVRLLFAGAMAAATIARVWSYHSRSRATAHRHPDSSCSLCQGRGWQHLSCGPYSGSTPRANRKRETMA